MKKLIKIYKSWWTLVGAFLGLVCMVVYISIITMERQSTDFITILWPHSFGGFLIIGSLMGTVFMPLIVAYKTRGNADKENPLD